jgi:Fic family protein
MINTGSITITPELLVLIAEVDEFKGAWRALGTLAPARLSALRRVATIESIGSSTRIEGSHLSDRDVERLLANLEIKAFDTRDEQEVAGYAEVMERRRRPHAHMSACGHIDTSPPIIRMFAGGPLGDRLQRT